MSHSNFSKVILYFVSWLRGVLGISITCSNPVSYTHLDVYKRQKQGCCIAPTLFKIYLNEAVTSWKKNAVIHVGRNDSCKNNGNLNDVRYTAVAPRRVKLNGAAAPAFNIIRNTGLYVNHITCARPTDCQQKFIYLCIFRSTE